MFKFIHLSDLHISTSLAGISVPNTAEIANSEIEQILDYIEEHYPKHYIIITGDITDNGMEFDEAKRLLKRFIGRIFVCPGNHDTGLIGNLPGKSHSVMFDTLAKYLMGQAVEYSSNIANVSKVSDDSDSDDSDKSVISLIGIDSNRDPVPFSPPTLLNPIKMEWLAQGNIGDEQLDQLNSLLKITDPARSDSNFIQIVYLHHHPFNINSSDPDKNLMLTDAKKFLSVIKNRIDLLLFGHKHYQVMGSAPAYGIKHWLCSGASPKEKYAREISIGGMNAKSTISIRDIPIR